MLWHRDFLGAELDGPDNDLSGTCLAGANFSSSVIVANFQNADLRGAKLSEANVKTCDFSGADLRDCDFRNAALCSTTFRNAKLQGARFEGAFYHSWHLRAGERPDW